VSWKPDVTVRRFHLITETDALALEPGSTVELEPGGMVTPLARETLAARRITVAAAGSTDPALPADLPPAADVRRVAIGSDHTGVALKAALVAHLRQDGRTVTDHGTQGTEAVDYPDIAERVSRAVARGEADGGIVIDGAGLGSAIAANKVKGIRAAMCLTPTLARYSREHNGANVLTLGATLLTAGEAIAIVDTWLSTPMREARYIRRLLKIRRLEDIR
jgi:ribose 5-phosphate isomerase B